MRPSLVSIPFCPQGQPVMGGNSSAPRELPGLPPPSSATPGLCRVNLKGLAEMGGAAEKESGSFLFPSPPSALAPAVGLGGAGMGEMPPRRRAARQPGAPLPDPRWGQLDSEQDAWVLRLPLTPCASVSPSAQPRGRWLMDGSQTQGTSQVHCGIGLGWATGAGDLKLGWKQGRGTNETPPASTLGSQDSKPGCDELRGLSSLRRLEQRGLQGLPGTAPRERDPGVWGAAGPQAIVGQGKAPPDQKAAVWARRH